MAGRIELTQEFLKECLHYNELLGHFIWKVRPLYHFKNKHGQNYFNARFAGEVAGGLDEKGYVRVRISDFRFKVHRLVFLYLFGEVPEYVDHINGIKDDNRLLNLRGASNKDNCRNIQVKPMTNIQERYGKFRVKMSLGSGDIYFGTHESLELAQLVRDETRLKYFGEFSGRY